MNKLANLVTVFYNDDDCIVLDVKKDVEDDLICLGCFSGDETRFRVTKGDHHTITVWHKDRKPNSWEWGDRGYTCVCDNLRKIREMLFKTIVEDLGIKLYAYRERGY